MIFQISPKLSIARDLPQTYRQTVPQTRPCNSKASITKSVVGSWNWVIFIGHLAYIAVLPADHRSQWASCCSVW